MSLIELVAIDEDGFDITDCDWDLVRWRLDSHPEELAETDIDGRSALQIACEFRFDEMPLDVLERMLRLDRIRVEETNNLEEMAACRLYSGRAIPLYSVKNWMFDVDAAKIVRAIELFILHAPECLTVTTDVRNETVLHSSVCLFSILSSRWCQKLTLKMCKMFVQANGGLLTKKGADGAPLHYILTRVKNGVIQPELRYETVDTLTPVRTRGGGNLLHRIAEFGLTSQLQWVRLSEWIPLFDSLVQEQDDDGNTPMHVALINDPRFVILNEASMHLVNKKGQYPLDLLLRLDGVTSKAILQVMDFCPGAFRRLHLVDRLYPLVFEKVQPSTVYELLSSRPSLVGGGSTKERLKQEPSRTDA